MTIHKGSFGDQAEGNVTRRPASRAGIRPKGHYVVECYRPDGSLRWRDEIDNLVVNAGLDHIMATEFAGGTQVDPWYIGLLAASPTPLATWTATEIATNDFVDYTESVLQTFVDANTGTGQLDNSASKAQFSINQDTSSIGGAFLISTSAKATPAGTLYSAGAFTGGNKAADNGDTLQVTLTLTAADDGV